VEQASRLKVALTKWSTNDDPSMIEELSIGPELTPYIDKVEDFINKIKSGYSNDPLYSQR